MKAYFLNISEEEKKSITEKHRELYNGYQVMQPKGNMTPLNVEDLAGDKNGVTVNSRGDVTEYKNTGINKPMKSICNECGELYEGEKCECGGGKEVMEDECKECSSNMYEGKLCECGSGMNEGECNECGVYSAEEIEEGIKIKSKKGSVIREINESLNWFKKLI